jgi:hypothetical protein
MDNNAVYGLFKGASKSGRDTWTPVSFSGSVSHYNVGNGYQYSEIELPFVNIDYHTANPFKLVVTVAEEAYNTLIDAFPRFNDTDTISQYYYWGYLEDGMIPNQTFTVIGIKENEKLANKNMLGKTFLAMPNPFSSTIDFFVNASAIAGTQDATFCIFDVTGRMVHDFDLSQWRYSEVLKITWDGKDDRGMQVARGVYFCELITDQETVMEKIIYIR